MLAAGATTDTLTVRVNLPIDAVEMGVVVDLVATDGTDDYRRSLRPSPRLTLGRAARSRAKMLGLRWG